MQQVVEALRPFNKRGLLRPAPTTSEALGREYDRVSAEMDLAYTCPDATAVLAQSTLERQRDNSIDLKLEELEEDERIAGIPIPGDTGGIANIKLPLQR